MNNEIKQLKEIKIRLDKTGPGFCLAKWYHVSMHLHTGTNHSCYHPAPKKVELSELEQNPEALHNSVWKKQQRKIMLEGGRPDECSYCWAIEDLPGEQISDRVLRSNDPWCVDLLNETAKIDWNKNVNPRYLEINFGFECQLKCSYCASTISSSWYNEIKKYGDYPLQSRKNRKQYSIHQIQNVKDFYKTEEDNPYITAFWKWFPTVYDSLTTLRITGGEPLLSSNLFKMLDYIDAHPNPKMEFAINSNMCVPERNLQKFIEYGKRLKVNKKLDILNVFTSVDTWGSQAEWIRNGFNMEVWEKNISNYLEQVPGSTIHLMITFCFLSMPQFEKLLDKVLELRRKYTKQYQKITIDTPYLIEPPHLSCQITDDKMLQKLKTTLDYMKSLVDDNNLHKFSSKEYAKLERVVSWIEHNRFTEMELKINRMDFVRFVQEHDARRNTNFEAAFPELIYFLQEHES